MHDAIMMIAAYLGAARNRINAAMNDDDGFSTLEWIIIGLGVFLAAGAAVVVITTAITNRTALIN